MKSTTIDIQKVEKGWKSRGFEGGLWIDPPGQVWKDYIHGVDELVMLVQGEVEIDMEGATHTLEIGKELLIPADTYHTVRTSGRGGSQWLYSYKKRN